MLNLIDGSIYIAAVNLKKYIVNVLFYPKTKNVFYKH